MLKLVLPLGLAFIGLALAGCDSDPTSPSQVCTEFVASGRGYCNRYEWRCTSPLVLQDMQNVDGSYRLICRLPKKDLSVGPGQ